MKTGFWKALIGSCSGTAIFVALREQRVWRAILHLLFMVFLCSMVMSWGYQTKVRSVVERAANVFFEKCGGIRMDEYGITPLESPEKARSFLLPGPWAVTYLPVISPVDEPSAISLDIEQGAAQGGIWSSKHFVLWQKENGIFEARAVSRERGGLDKPVKFTSSGELLNYIAKSAPSGLETRPGESITLNKNTFQQIVKAALPLGIGAMVLQRTLSEVVIYILMFAAVFTLMNLGRPVNRISFKELLVLEIYAGFPPMIIGSAATALSLPFLEFNLVYVMGMTLYLIWILNHLNALQEERARRDHDSQAEGRK